METSQSPITDTFSAYTGAVQRESESLGFPVIALGLLITSYFYVLPLERLSFAGFATDFRIYDFAFLVFMLLVGIPEWSRLRRYWEDRKGLFFWGGILIIVIWFSLVLTLAFGGVNNLLVGGIRAFRFTAYLLAAGYVFALVDTSRRYRFILSVIYINIAIQAGLSFAQEFGWLPGFWPQYWGADANAFPVGTLSWHHKQTGIVMLMGIALSLTFLRQPYGLFRRPFAIFLMGMMILITVFTASRTGWGGLAVMLLAYLFIHRLGGFGVLIIGALGLLLAFWLARDLVEPSAMENLNVAYFDVVERQGTIGLISERLEIYDDFPNAIQRSPWILLVGAGFQNINRVLRGATGAHNNYIQAWFETGIIGFLVYLRFLFSILSSLWKAGGEIQARLEATVAKDIWALFVGILATMMFGETFWAQYSMFTLTGQILTLVALAVSPRYWDVEEERQEEDNELGSTLLSTRTW